MKTRLLLALALSVALLAGAVGMVPLSRSASEADRQSPDSQANSSGSVIVKIADRTFEIPRVYIDLDAQKDVIEGEAALVYVLPGFEPEPPHPEERAKRKKLILQGRLRGMYISAASMRPSLDTAADNHLRRWKYEKVSDDVFGLEKYAAPPIGGEEGHHLDSILLERNDSGLIVSYLHCSPPGKDKIPGCRHRFESDGIVLQTHWSISDLPKWKESQIEALEFLRSFELKN